MKLFISDKVIYFFFFAFFFSSCGSSKKGQEDFLVRLPKIKKEVLIERLEQAATTLSPKHFFVRINSKFSNEENNMSFKTSVRMRADSALQATITYANIPIYNAMITPDSLTIVDRRGQCYIQEQMSFFKRQFNVDFDYKNIEELLLGKPIAWSKENNYRLVKDPYHYALSLEESFLEDEEVTILYYLDNNAQYLEKTIIDSPKDSSIIEIGYGARNIMEEYAIPEFINIKIRTPKGESKLSLKYGKVELNEPRIFFMVIPDKYEQCE